MTTPEPPSVLRAVAFIDGQNLYHHAKDAFGHHYPNYDPHKLHNAVCAANGWKPHGVRFYTGTPSPTREPMMHGFWSKRLLAMKRAGIAVFSREIRYRTQEIALPDGTIYEVDTPQEKGVDVRIAIDLLRMAVEKHYEVAVIFSQDQDFIEAAKEIREISKQTSRWIKIVSAFPSGSEATSNRGIDKTDWFRMDRQFYDNCLDGHDYRPQQSVTTQVPIPRIRLKEHAPY